MKKTILKLAKLLLLLSSVFEINADSAVTYNLNGRLGDNIITYIKAKWVSEHYGIPLLYKPFHHSSKLHIDVLEKKHTKHITQTHTIKKVKTATEIEDTIGNNNILYITDLKFTAPAIDNMPKLQHVMTHNKKFKNKIKTMIAPIQGSDIFQPPCEAISIAVHIRTGGGFDAPLISEQIYYGHESLVEHIIQVLPQNADYNITQDTHSEPVHDTDYEDSQETTENFTQEVNEDIMQEVNELDPNCVKRKILNNQYADKIWPNRFPPLQFYIDQIVYLQKYFNYAPLFIHVFTDHKNPKALVNEIKKNINYKNVRFQYRSKSNTYDSSALDDLFAMAQYNCLIRPASSFSKVAQLLGNHKIIIYPSKSTWLTENRLLINKINVLFTKDPETLQGYFSAKAKKYRLTRPS